MVMITKMMEQEKKNVMFSVLSRILGLFYLNTDFFFC
jgi:hypothetical protein